MFEKYWKVDGYVAIPHSKYNFYINVSGEVINETGRRVDLTKDDDGYLQVFADLWDGLRQYRIMDIVAIIFKKIQIPVGLWNEVAGFPLNGDPSVTHASNVAYRFRSGPLQCPNYPEFYYIPMFTKYGMDEDGVLAYINGRVGIKTFYITKPNPKKNILGGYRVTTIFSDLGEPRGASRHRLRMLTFSEYPDGLEKLVVNHIDGIPGNDDLDNLEWTTRSGNLNHAMESGLRNDNKPILVRNVLTGEVTRYYSISECARALGFPTDETIRQRVVSSEFGKVFSDGTQFKLEEDSRDWIVPEDPQKAVEAAKLSRPILVKDVATGAVEWYSSAKMAGKVIGIKGGTLTYRMKNDLRVPYLGYQFKYEDDIRDWYEYTAAEMVTESMSGAKAIVVATPEGEIEYPSIKQACKYHSLPNVVIYLLRDKQPQYSNGLSVRKENDDWEVDKFEYVYVGGFVARHIGTGEETRGKSATALAAKLDVPSTYAKMCADSKGVLVYGGYQFRSDEIKDPWPMVPREDIELILSGVPKSGVWKKMINIETGEVRYFQKTEDVATYFGYAHRSPIVKAVKEQKLLEGKFKVESYRPTCLLNTQKA